MKTNKTDHLICNSRGEYRRVDIEKFFSRLVRKKIALPSAKLERGVWTVTGK